MGPSASSGALRRLVLQGVRVEGAYLSGIAAVSWMLGEAHRGPRCFEKKEVAPDNHLTLWIWSTKG